ncbi:MAG: DUF2283 domain-containing protein [Chloroflexi bacterium]|nr:DUF2283 domain-containing protein [Chloroflexota bacterium]MDA1218828.1 DUF2283 domain-containing protein [Chloroflexota bacterium]
MNDSQLIDYEAVGKANFDLLERLIGLGAEIAYDEDSDVLFITIGHEPNEAVTEHLIDTIYYRIDPDSLKIVGITILEFMTNILAKNRLAVIAFGDDFTKLRAKGGRTRMEGIDAKRLAPLFEAMTSPI